MSLLQYFCVSLFHRYTDLTSQMFCFLRLQTVVCSLQPSPFLLRMGSQQSLSHWDGRGIPWRPETLTLPDVKVSQFGGPKTMNQFHRDPFSMSPRGAPGSGWVSRYGHLNPVTTRDPRRSTLASTMSSVGAHVERHRSCRTLPWRAHVTSRTPGELPCPRGTRRNRGLPRG